VIEFARAVKRTIGCEVICLTSDIYSLDGLRSLSSLVDYFVAPTSHHAEVLRSAVWRPVFVVPEGIDAIAMPSSDGLHIPVAENNRIAWFGYPESFSKAMKHLLPRALYQSRTPATDLQILTAPNHQLIAGAEHVDFHVESFYRAIAKCGYTLLSHFAFDHHINSYIKSPNKLITSLVRGCVPIVSDTPNYRSVMQYYDLMHYTYCDGEGLVRLLERRNISRDRDRVQLELIGNDLQDRFSPANVASVFANHFAGMKRRRSVEKRTPWSKRNENSTLNWPSPVEKIPPLRIDGAIEFIGDRSIRGWAKVPNIEDSVIVEAVLKGVNCGRVTTSIFRPDLNGYFGFEICTEEIIDASVLLTGDLIVRAFVGHSNTTELGPTDSARSEILNQWAQQLLTMKTVVEVVHLLDRLTD
jgi:hypothetical protein